MMRAGYSYGTLDYKTNTIPTLGASNSTPHTQAIAEIQKIIDAELHPVRTYLRNHFSRRNKRA